jgi:pimeloyl-ACP methyl ester carboxylesterase
LQRLIKFAAFNAAIVGILASAIVFALGAVAAENALRPRRRPVALVCPCLANVHCESVNVAAQDGIALRGWYYWPETPNGSAIVLVHGIGSNRQDMVALGYLFLRHGYSVLEPDLRGHGESGGFATYGVLEENDIHAWLDWLDKTGHSPRIYGIGASLGAAVLLDSLKHESRFRAIVAESSYSDFPSIARERIARMLPVGSQWIAAPFVQSGIAWVRYRDGIDLRNASPADGLISTKVPVLLIHGLADNKTSPENSRRLAAVNPAVQLWLVPGSGHADAWQTAPTEFESRVTGWFSTH